MPWPIIRISSLIVDLLAEGLLVVGVYQAHLCATPMLPQGSSCNFTGIFEYRDTSCAQVVLQSAPASVDDGTVVHRLSTNLLQSHLL